MDMEKFFNLPAIVCGFRNFLDFGKQYFGDQNCQNYFYLRSGQVIKVNDKNDFWELLNIVVLKRFGQPKQNSFVIDLSPKTGCFSLCLATKAPKTLLYQPTAATFAENLRNNSKFTNNFQVIPYLSTEKSVLEQLFSLTDNSNDVLLHLSCSTPQQYELIYQAPTKFLPLVEQFCIEYRDVAEGYDMENLVKYICTVADYRMQQLSLAKDRSGTIWLERR